MNSFRSRFSLVTLILVWILSFTTPSSAVSKLPPTKAPVVTLISRGNNFVKIDFQTGSSLGATGYQYSIDGGQSWVTGKVKSSAITVSQVPLTTRAQISLRGTNKYGSGPASPVSGTKRVVYLGASVTAGMDGHGHGWAREAASTLGWQYSNVSSIKSGYYSPQKDGIACSGIINFSTQVTCAAAYLPDVVIISGGYNDCLFVQKSSAKLQTRIQKVFEKLHETFGSAEIIATPVISTSTETCLTTINNWIAASAQTIGAKYVTGAEQWVTSHPEWQGTAVHPNQAGHAVITANFVSWYGSLTNSGN